MRKFKNNPFIDLHRFWQIRKLSVVSLHPFPLLTWLYLSKKEEEDDRVRGWKVKGWIFIF
jgi:hypothetical protein